MQVPNITTISASGLPSEIMRLHKPPSRLFAQGNLDLLHRHPRAGIVGARKFTSYGREVTVNIASALAREGVTIVSGLAIGVDSIAHKACLDNGGKTIAVLPSGLQNIYPASHYGLAKNIIGQNGLLVTEYPEKFRPHKVSFLERNRIIAALSDVLIITEAAVSSGSLNTANYALELGIPIMAVPGNITSPYSAGTNNIIKSGAYPLTDSSDVLSLLGIEPSDKSAYIPESKPEQAIINTLKSGITSTNELLAGSKLDVSTAQTTLTLLEMKGIVSAQAGHWYIN